MNPSEYTQYVKEYVNLLNMARASLTRNKNDTDYVEAVKKIQSEAKSRLNKKYREKFKEKGKVK